MSRSFSGAPRYGFRILDFRKLSRPVSAVSAFGLETSSEHFFQGALPTLAAPAGARDVRWLRLRRDPPRVCEAG